MAFNFRVNAVSRPGRLLSSLSSDLRPEEKYKGEIKSSLLFSSNKMKICICNLYKYIAKDIYIHISAYQLTADRGVHSKCQTSYNLLGHCLLCSLFYTYIFPSTQLWTVTIFSGQAAAQTACLALSCINLLASSSNLRPFSQLGPPLRLSSDSIKPPGCDGLKKLVVDTLPASASSWRPRWVNPETYRSGAKLVWGEIFRHISEK